MQRIRRRDLAEGVPGSNWLERESTRAFLILPCEAENEMSVELQRGKRDVANQRVRSGGLATGCHSAAQKTARSAHFPLGPERLRFARNEVLAENEMSVEKQGGKPSDISFSAGNLVPGETEPLRASR